MDILLQLVGGVAGIVVLVCHIMVIIKMFQAGQTALGIVLIILTCCGIGILVTLIYGWVKATDWNIKNLMLIYTVAFVLNLVMGGANYSKIQTQIQELQKQK